MALELLRSVREAWSEYFGPGDAQSGADSLDDDDLECEKIAPEPLGAPTPPASPERPAGPARAMTAEELLVVVEEQRRTIERLEFQARFAETENSVLRAFSMCRA